MDVAQRTKSYRHWFDYHLDTAWWAAQGKPHSVATDLFNMYPRVPRFFVRGALLIGAILEFLLLTPAWGFNVVAWGGNHAGETNACAQNVVAISAGDYHTLLLKRDGTVATCGKYVFDPYVSGTPPAQPAGLAGVVAIASGGAHGLALHADGTVSAWGDNSLGQTNVPSSLSGVIAIAAGRSHNLALKNDGTVVQWGRHHWAAEDEGVPADLTNVVAIAAGTGSAALKGDGTIVAWNAGATAKASLEAITNAVGISGGWQEWLILIADGTVRRLYFGVPAVLPQLGDVEDIVASPGSDHHVSLALTRQGTVIGWGFNFYQAQGIPTVLPGLSGVIAITAGSGHQAVLVRGGAPFITAQPVGRTVVMSGTTCFRVKATGAHPLTYQWKHNGVDIPGATTSRCLLTNLQPAQAGDYSVEVRYPYGSATSAAARLSLVPLQIDQQPKSQSQYVSGTAIIDVVVRGIEPLHYQWRHNGTNLVGATQRVLSLSNLGFENAGTYSVVVTNAHGEILSEDVELMVLPVLITGQPKDVVSYRGGRASFSVEAEGMAPISYQWLHNDVPLAGATGPTLELTSLRQEQAGSYRVTMSNVFGEADSAAAQLSLPSVVAWGDLDQSSVPEYLTNVIGIASGNRHNLALTGDRVVVGWGEQGSNVPPAAVNIAALGRTGYSGESVAIKPDGSVVGWGANVPSLAGISNVVAAAVAYDFVAVRADGSVAASGYGARNVPAGLSNIVSVAVGYAHGLALKSDGKVIAWGLNDQGQTNVPSNLTNAVAIAAYYNNSMALRHDGTVAVWGYNWQGQTNVPAGLSNVVRIAAGEYHCMALKADGTVAVWGDNWKGQTNVPPGLTNVVAIATGGRHCLALLGDGPPVVSEPFFDVAFDEGRFSARIPTESGRVYRLEYKEDLTQPEWRGVGLTMGTGEPVLLTDPTSIGQTRFYRVRDW